MGWEDGAVIVALCLLIQWCVVGFALLWRSVFKVDTPQGTFRRKAVNRQALRNEQDPVAEPEAGCIQPKPLPKPLRLNRKPDWVVAEVLRFKAHMQEQGCRKVAQVFNQHHGPVCTVSKSWVADVLQRNQYSLARLYRDIKNKKPSACAVNAVWAMDLTFQADQTGVQQVALGVIDHGSRALLCLQTIIHKSSWTLVGMLCLTIGRYGKPKAVRTDNELVFSGGLFKRFLAMAGIQHQRTQLHSPWQNGRIERLFGTLKPLLKQLVIPSRGALQMVLDEFRLFYNHCRTHQNLNGLTPAQAWNKVTWTDLKQNPPKEITLVHALEGICVGYHIRR